MRVSRSSTVPSPFGSPVVEIAQRHLARAAFAGDVSLHAARVCGANSEALQIAVRHRAMEPREAALQAAEALDLALTTGGREHVRP